MSQGKEKTLVRNIFRQTLSEEYTLFLLCANVILPISKAFASGHAFGSAAECLLIWAQFQGILSLVFHGFLYTVGN